MIIFTDKVELIQPIYQKFNKRAMRVMNLSSLYSGYHSLTDLITLVAPINNTQMPHGEFVYSVEFDIQYANALINDHRMFHHLMEIMIPAREGEVIIILVQRDQFRDAVMESLIKFIQQRYGYNSWIVDDFDDISYLKETTFSTYGLITLDADINAHDRLYSSGGADPIMNPNTDME